MRRPYAACLAACTVLLSACGGLSTSSAVHQGLDVSTVQENEVRVLVNPVAAGSSPEEVVAGFIRAAAANDDQYQVARSYLVPAQEATWRPDSSVVVFPDDSSLTVTRSGTSSVKVVAQVSGRIDGDGRYHELAPGSTVSASFGLQRIKGEWRISSLPEGFGIWLNEADVSRLYDPFRIYFISALERRLVPDVRWFPVGTGLATRLARTLLAGPPDYLHGAVRSEIPVGTRLAVDSVPIESGTAQVDLTATRVSSDPGQRQGLAAQLLATVSQALGVERVALKLDGTDLQVPGAPSTGLVDLGALGFLTPADVVTKPVLRKGTTLVAVDPQQLGDPGNRAVAQPNGSWPPIPAGWTYLGMAPSGGEVAAVSGSRTQLERWRGSTQLPVLTLGSALTRPVYDSTGVLWVGGVQKGVSRLWAINPGADPKSSPGQPQPVSASWLDGRTVVSLRFAPEGQRVAVISTDRSGRHPRIDVAGVVRQPNGLPEALSAPITLAPSLTMARDLVWVDDTTLAVLGRKLASQAVRPWFVPLGGPITAGPEIPGAATITTVNAERGLVVTTDSGGVLVRVGNRWQTVGPASDFLVPGR